MDEKGLLLQVEPSGGRLWRLKYRFAGKEKKLALGAYPETGLKEARDKRDEARRLLGAGVDPGEQKKAEKTEQATQAANTFRDVADESPRRSGKGWPLSPWRRRAGCWICWPRSWARVLLLLSRLRIC